jgi:hypothetical protein
LIEKDGQLFSWLSLIRVQALHQLAVEAQLLFLLLDESIIWNAGEQCVLSQHCCGFRRKPNVQSPTGLQILFDVGWNRVWTPTSGLQSLERSE